MNNPAMQMSLFTMPCKWSPATLRELIETTNQVGMYGRKMVKQRKTRRNKTLEEDKMELRCLLDVSVLIYKSARFPAIANNRTFEFCEGSWWRMRLVQTFASHPLLEPQTLIIIIRMKPPWNRSFNRMTYTTKGSEGRTAVNVTVAPVTSLRNHRLMRHKCEDNQWVSQLTRASTWNLVNARLTSQRFAIDDKRVSLNRRPAFYSSIHQRI